jgi:hypothetical protein
MIDEFTAIRPENGRIVGWNMAFRDGTTITTAEQQVRAELPADARQTASRRATFRHSPDTCEIVSFQSRSLTKVLGPGSGTAGVKLYQIGVTGERSPSIQVIDKAVIQVPAFAASSGC